MNINSHKYTVSKTGRTVHPYPNYCSVATYRNQLLSSVKCNFSIEYHQYLFNPLCMNLYSQCTFAVRADVMLFLTKLCIYNVSFRQPLLRCIVGLFTVTTQRQSLSCTLINNVSQKINCKELFNGTAFICHLMHNICFLFKLPFKP